jgi:hypothetical protein
MYLGGAWRGSDQSLALCRLDVDKATIAVAHRRPVSEHLTYPRHSNSCMHPFPIHPTPILSQSQSLNVNLKLLEQKQV